MFADIKLVWTSITPYHSSIGKMHQVMSNVKVEHLTIAVKFQGNLFKGHHSADTHRQHILVTPSTGLDIVLSVFEFGGGCLALRIICLFPAFAHIIVPILRVFLYTWVDCR